MDRSTRIELAGTTLLFFHGLGVTAGAHRLWCHRTYKAKVPLRVFLMLMDCMACQNSIYEWVRDHRVHHKYAETDGDPHNIKRGFFFAHIGWLMCRKHPDVIKRGKALDMSDVIADPVVRFQQKYYIPLTGFVCFVLPPLVAMSWGESFLPAFWGLSFFRYVLSLHFTWLVNSAAHLWGVRPYDPTITATDSSLVAFFAIGEGFHNYHHTFPWDYSTSELGWKFNFSTMFIDLMAKIGQAYDRKVVSPRLLQEMKAKTAAYDVNNNKDRIKISREHEEEEYKSI
ncbi:SCD [Cordylochernes scorpioides]|uniref:SCD n=1 Tax=Cordylochernes scorpioides TaxID=51811 RepID=A0ABY6LQR2_9ARAC|nr:SCD [Cordylochernes scorpioides]